MRLSALVDTINAVSTNVSVMDLAEVEELSRYLFSATVEHGTSRVLRKACHRIGRLCLERSRSATINSILHAIQQGHLALGLATASSDAYICLEWTTIFLECEDFFNDSELFTRVLILHALLFDTCISSSAKSGLRKSSVRQVRSGLRKLFISSKESQHVIKYSIGVLTTGQTSTRNAPLIGQIMIASGFTTFEESVSLVIDYFCTEFLTSKSLVSRSSVQGLIPVFRFGIPSGILQNKLLPVILKTLLRAPEIVTDPILSVFLESVHFSEASDRGLLAGTLSRPLINVYKSTNQLTREGGHNAIKALLKNSADCAEIMQKELINALVKERLGVDQRIMLARSLADVALTVDSAHEYVVAVLPSLAKESNEVVQVHMISSILRALDVLAGTEWSPPETFYTVVRNAIIDRKTTIRNHWLCGLATLLLAHQKPVIAYLEPVMTILLSAWSTDTKTPLQTIQSGLISGTYALTIILLISSSQPTIGTSFLRCLLLLLCS